MTREERFARDVRETAETLVEDRGRDNALVWAEHCMTRDPSGGFWRAVRDAILAASGLNFKTVDGRWVRIAEGD